MEFRVSIQGAILGSTIITATNTHTAVSRALTGWKGERNRVDHVGPCSDAIKKGEVLTITVERVA